MNYSENDGMPRNRFNPPGSCSTGDVEALVVGQDVWRSQVATNDGSQLLNDAGLLRYVLNDGDSFLVRAPASWYDAGMCNGQPPAMKPSYEVRLRKTRFPLRLYYGFNRCLGFNHVADNVGLALVVDPDFCGDKPASFLNGTTLEYSVQATWPGAEDYLFGFFPRESKPPPAGEDPLAPAACERACKGTFSYNRTTKHCDCGEPFYAAWEAPDVATGKVIVSTDAPQWLGKKDRAALSPPPDRKQEAFFTRDDNHRSEDGLQDVMSLLLMHQAASALGDSMAQSACSMGADSSAWTKENRPQACAFGVLSWVGSVPAGATKPQDRSLTLRLKAGADAQGWGSTLYLMPFSGPKNVAGLGVKDDTGSASKEFEKTQTITLQQNRYNGASGFVDVKLTFDPTTPKTSSVHVLIAFSGFTDSDALKDVNMLMIASNTVLDITCDSAMERTPGAAHECLYPPATDTAPKGCEGCRVPCPPPSVDDGGDSKKDTSPTEHTEGDADNTDDGSMTKFLYVALAALAILLVLGVVMLRQR